MSIDKVDSTYNCTLTCACVALTFETFFSLQAEGSAVRRVRMMCRNLKSFQMEMRVVQVALPTGCMCRPCANVADKVPDVLNPTQHKVIDILAFEKKHS